MKAPNVRCPCGAAAFSFGRSPHPDPSGQRVGEYPLRPDENFMGMRVFADRDTARVLDRKDVEAAQINQG